MCVYVYLTDYQQQLPQAAPQPLRKPERPVKRAAEDNKDASGKHAKAEVPMKQDTPTKRSSNELSPALLKAVVVDLARASGAISLSDIIEHLAKEKGMNKKDVKKYLLKKARISLEQDRLTLA